MIATLAVTLLLTQYTATEAKSVFDEANEAALAGDTAKAQAGYQKLLSAKQGGADVLFNLGSACLMGNDLGPAVLALERSKRLSADDDIEAQLAVARAKQLDKVVGAETERPFVQRLAEAVSPTIVSLLCLLGLWSGMGLLLWARRSRSWPWALASAACLLVGVIGSGLVLTQAWVASHIKEAVVMREAVQVRDAARNSARVSFEVHAGLKVRVMDQSGPYTRIRLANALEGWVDSRAVEAL